MLNWILSSSILIAVVLLLRRLLRDRIDPRLTYALWLLVALRILIPGSLFTLPVSVSSLAEGSGLTEAVEEVRYITEHETTYSSSTGSYNDDPSSLEDAEWFQDADWFGYRDITDVQIVDKQEVTAAEAGGNPESDSSYARLELEITRDRFFTLRVIWCAGIAVMVLWFLLTNLRFRLRLRRSALPARVDSPLPVRVMPDLVSPCLCGLFRPTIYVTPDCLTDETRLSHVLTHELTHHRHKDHWWAALRCVCLCVQWFNPLVWLAAYLSRQDCELACDTSVIKHLGEDQRLSYGKTLVDMVAAIRTPGALLQTATTMTGGKKSITQRIRLIVKRPKMTAATLIAVLLIAALAVGCTFSGAEDAEVSNDPPNLSDSTQEPEPPVTDSPANSSEEPEPSASLPADPSAELSETYLTYLVLEPEIALLNSNSFTFSDPEELSVSQLYTLFLVLTDYEILEQKYNAGDELFYFTGDFITAQLRKYFKSFRFDITEHERYDPAADAIVTPIASGFGGDRYTQMTSLEWADENTVVFTLNFYDNYELTGTPYTAKEYAIEFYNGGYYYLYAVERNPAAELAQSVYAAIVGDYAGRDCRMLIYDDRPTRNDMTTHIHLTRENSWNLPSDITDFEWAYTSPDGGDSNFGLSLSSADGETWLYCWKDTGRVRLHVNGQDYFLTATVPEGHNSLFDTLLWVSENTLIREAYDIVISGSFSDYGMVVAAYAQQFAANLNSLPDWAPSKPEGVVYCASSVSQAYFGEGTENFCSSFILYFSPEMGNSIWQAGSGMEEETEGKYAGWWKWSIGADFARNEDGHWVCTGTYTGGVGLSYPTPLSEATVEELVHYFYHTWGSDHDYLIPYYICQKPVSELDALQRALDTQEQPSSLCLALGTFLRDYGEQGDILLTYDVLSAGLDSQYSDWLTVGYTNVGIPE